MKNKVKLNDFAAELFEKNDELEEVKNELTNLRKLISTLQKDSDELDFLKAQIEVYRYMIFNLFYFFHILDRLKNNL